MDENDHPRGALLFMLVYLFISVRSRRTLCPNSCRRLDDARKDGS